MSSLSPSASLACSSGTDAKRRPRQLGLAGRKESIILITAKDAVKCARIPEIKNDDRIWVIGLEVVLDAYLVDIVDQKAAAAAQRMGRHPETRNDKIE